VQQLRSSIRRHRGLAACLIALALAMKALVPAGYMVGSTAHVLTIEICADSLGKHLTQTVLVPGESKPAEHAKTDGTCNWGALGMAGLAGADLGLLALALAFILLLSTAPVRPVRERRSLHLRPPLRGPPATV
jgi:hypothetical protein